MPTRVERAALLVWSILLAGCVSVEPAEDPSAIPTTTPPPPPVGRDAGRRPVDPVSPDAGPSAPAVPATTSDDASQPPRPAGDDARAGGEDAAPDADDARADGPLAADAPPPVSSAACKDLPICDGFESYAAGSAPGGIWTRTQTGGNELRVDGTRAFSGKNSVLFRGTSTSRMRATIDNTSKLPLPSRNGMWGRMMVWWDQLPQRGVHWDIIEASGEGRTYRWGGQFGVMANYLPGDCYKHFSVTIPTSRWVCVEWEFQGNNDELRLYFDGAKVAELIEAGSCAFRAPAAFTRLSIGWRHHQTVQRTTSMWVDDLAVAGARIGCPAPR